MPAARTKATSTTGAAAGAAGKGRGVGVGGANKKARRADVSLDGADMLGISSQLSSEAGSMPGAMWHEVIEKDVKARFLRITEGSIKDFKAEEARIYKKHTAIVDDTYTEFAKLQADFFARLGEHTQSIVEALRHRMAHEKLVEERAGKAAHAINAAALTADETIKVCASNVQEAVKAQEVIGNTANLRLSFSEAGYKNIPVIDSIKAKATTDDGVLYQPVGGAIKTARKPRKTDDTLVDYDFDFDAK